MSFIIRMIQHYQLLAVESQKRQYLILCKI